MPRKPVHASFALTLFSTFLFVCGCGGQTSVPEKSDSLAKSSSVPAPPAIPAEAGKSVNGAATAVATEPAALTSGPATVPGAAQPVAKPAAPALPAEAADTRQLARVLDLSKLAAPEGATMGLQSPTHMQVGVPLPVPAAVDFYVKKLDALGWKREGPATSESITDSFAQLGMCKDGHLLRITAIGGQPKESSITFEQAGNLDSRTLPRIEGAEDQFSDQSSSLYFAKAKIDEATATLRRLLNAAGWQEYDRAFSQKAVRPDAEDLLFRKKAYSLGVSISKPAARPNMIAVQYFVKTLARDLPAPADAKHVEIEDSRWILKCEVPGDLKSAADYYRTAMREIGFPDPPRETPFGKELALSFESPDHDLVLVSLTGTGDHATKVKLEGYSAAFREAMKKAEAAEKLKQEARAKEEARAKAEMAKEIKAACKRQDEMMQSAIEKAMKNASQPAKQSDLSKKIQADVEAELEKAFKDKPPAGDQPEK
jgi:hypothetical protein